MIKEIEVNDTIYPIKQHSTIKEEGPNTYTVETFSTTIGGKEYALEVSYTQAVVQDLEILYSIDAKAELEIILNRELKNQIFNLVNGTSTIELVDKLTKCSTDKELNSLVESDPVFAKWIEFAGVNKL